MARLGRRPRSQPERAQQPLATHPNHTHPRPRPGLRHAPTTTKPRRRRGKIVSRRARTGVRSTLDQSRSLHHPTSKPASSCAPRLGRHSGRVREQQLPAPAAPADDCEAVAALEPLGVSRRTSSCAAVASRPEDRRGRARGSADKRGGVRLRRNVVELAEPARRRVGPQLGRAPFSLNPVSLSVERPILEPGPGQPLRGSAPRRLSGEPKDSDCQPRSGERGIPVFRGLAELVLEAGEGL
jgi:hypothetical protein